MRIREHHLIFLGMIGGGVLGYLIGGEHGVPVAQNWFLEVCSLFGTTLFIGALKMIVAPLIFFSILASIVSLPTKGELWQIGWRTLVFYVLTTSVAVIIGLFLVLTIEPGMRGDREVLRTKAAHGDYGQKGYESKEHRIEEAKSQTPGQAIRENLSRIVQNPFQALSTANSLGIIFFAIVLGIALIAIGEAGRPVIPVIEGANAAIMKLTGWIMYLAPFFIFCLVTALVGEKGTAVFRSVAWYVATVLLGIGCHVVFLLLLVWLAGGKTPWAFLGGIRRAWAVAFATRSSAATLPVTMECVHEELGVPSKVTNFVLPLGATVNMDGTALYEGVAVIFLIQLFGGLAGVPADVSAVMTVIIFVTAVLASIGAAAVPDAGLVTMVLVANAVGLDPRYIAIIFAVDAFLDMFRTSTNVMGDSVGAVVVARLMGKGGAAA